ncbi:MAG: hypothetical protein U9O53_04350, partial [archaeon]|nr:hypothetical protein [archaeon]
MKKVLFVRPCHDDVTSYLYFYSRKLLEESENRGLKTINKEKDDANRGVVENIIDKLNPDFIMFNGHGNPAVVCGYHNKVIIENGNNQDLLKDRIIYSLSCSSASELGKAVGDSNTTFIG